MAPAVGGAEPAARVGDRVITVAEVDREWRRTDPASQIGLSRDVYEMRRRVLQTMVADELLAREAAARGLTVEALLAEEIPQADHRDARGGGGLACTRGWATGRVAHRSISCGRRSGRGCSR